MVLSHTWKPMSKIAKISSTVTFKRDQQDYVNDVDADLGTIFREMRSVPTVTTGIVAPASTPTQVGNLYIDTSAKKLYFATGVASSSDWTIAN